MFDVEGLAVCTENIQAQLPGFGSAAALQPVLKRLRTLERERLSARNSDMLTSIQSVR
jgi:hypothetical protein